jgi:hypothetical protein
MQPDPTNLLKRINLITPLIGFYDAPNISHFKPLVKPKPQKHMCIFSFYKRWMNGATLHITEDNSGCGGCGHWLFSSSTRSRKDYVKFLVDDEGLKSSHDLMNQWLDYHKPYVPQYPNILIGPLKQEQYEYLKSITFFVNPDQLSLLILGANYNNAPGDPPPVTSPFGSGCMELIPLFKNLDIPKAIIGATDIAMRQYLPPDILAFTVTKPMFKQLCELDEKSFLYKMFWDNLKKVRGI